MSSSVTATFVFTDLVDSTATAARLGPEAAEELRQTHFRLLRGAVTASGGTEVKNLGDGLMVMFSSPSRALSGAVGMAQAIEHHNRSSDEPLGVRIGVSAGEATEEDDDFFGDPVVEAARLCAAAQGGQILAADIVRSLVGRHATQTFVELGPLELKGLPEPVDVVEVVWEPAVVEGSVPLPGRLAGTATDALFGFFGRAAELEVLEEAAKAAKSSQRCQVVFIAGEAGMGKTSLTGQAARRAHGEGAVVLFGHADEDLGVAYQPWIEALACLVRFGDPEWVGGLRAAQRSALARLVPEIGTDADRVADPETERLLLLEGATELLVAASQQSPVMVVLDDLHWADTATLQLLRHVTSSATPMNVTIVCTLRDTDLSRGDALTKLLADMHREANVTRIAPQRPRRQRAGRAARRGGGSRPRRRRDRPRPRGAARDRRQPVLHRRAAPPPRRVGRDRPRRRRPLGPRPASSKSSASRPASATSSADASNASATKPSASSASPR